MIEVNKELMENARRLLNQGQKAKVISYLCEQGCNLEMAQRIIEEFVQNKDYLHGYVVERLLELLPSMRSKAGRIVSQYYNVRLNYAHGLITEMIENGVIDREGIQKVLEKLHPHQKSKTNQTAITHGVSNFNERVDRLILEGKQAQASEVLINEYRIDPRTANDLLLEAQARMKRVD